MRTWTSLGALILSAPVTKYWETEKNDCSPTTCTQQAGGVLECSCSCEHLHALCYFPGSFLLGPRLLSGASHFGRQVMCCPPRAVWVLRVP